MGRGGRRAGAGRKPKAKGAVVLGMDGARREGFALPGPLPETGETIEPPADLPEEERTIWRHLAPYALRERTLTASKMPGFRRLCRQWAYCQAFDQRIAELGVVSGEADRLLKRLEKWEQRLDSSLGNFGLRSFGKPVTTEKPKGAAANPFAALASR